MGGEPKLDGCRSTHREHCVVVLFERNETVSRCECTTDRRPSQPMSGFDVLLIICSSCVLGSVLASWVRKPSPPNSLLSPMTGGCDDRHPVAQVRPQEQEATLEACRGTEGTGRSNATHPGRERTALPDVQTGHDRPPSLPTLWCSVVSKLRGLNLWRTHRWSTATRERSGYPQILRESPLHS